MLVLNWKGIHAHQSPHSGLKKQESRCTHHGGYKVPFYYETEKQWTTLCELLDESEFWKYLADELHYSRPKISKLSKLDNSPQGSPSKAILEKWQHSSNASVAKFLEIMNKIKHCTAHDLVKEWVEKPPYDPNSYDEPESDDLDATRHDRQVWKRTIILIVVLIPLVCAIIWQNISKDSPDNIVYEKALELHQQGRYKEAMSLFEQAAFQGKAEAQHMLGCYHSFGHGVPYDDVQASLWFYKAASQGLAAAQYNLGIFYTVGKGVLQNYKEAAQWYQKAADQGYGPAQNSIGFLYRNGMGVEQNQPLAVSWYRKAADQGIAQAQFNLAFCYRSGSGVTQDYQQAATWYIKSAEQGQTLAQCICGIFYENGLGVQQDVKQAAHWYRKAAVQGVSLAQYSLARFYQEGIGGLPRDVDQYQYWKNQAAIQGLTGSVKLEKILNFMNNDQLTEFVVYAEPQYAPRS